MIILQTTAHTAEVTPTDLHKIPDSPGAGDEAISPMRFEMRTGSVRNQRGSHPLSSVVCGEICQDCNNGWMSQLETEAKPHLISLIGGDIVGAEATRVIARWTAKTACVMNIAMPYRLLWNRHDRHAISNGLPPNTNYGFSRERSSGRHVSWNQGSVFTLQLSDEEANEAGVIKRSESVHVFSLRLDRLVVHCFHQQGGQQFSLKGSFAEIPIGSKSQLRLNRFPLVPDGLGSNVIHMEPRPFSLKQNAASRVKEEESEWGPTL